MVPQRNNRDHKEINKKERRKGREEKWGAENVAKCSLINLQKSKGFSFLLLQLFVVLKILEEVGRKKYLTLNLINYLFSIY